MSKAVVEYIKPYDKFRKMGLLHLEQKMLLRTKTASSYTLVCRFHITTLFKVILSHLYALSIPYVRFLEIMSALFSNVCDTIKKKHKGDKNGN